MFTLVSAPYVVSQGAANRALDVWNSCSPHDERAQVIASGDGYALELVERPGIYVAPEL